MADETSLNSLKNEFQRKLSQLCIGPSFLEALEWFEATIDGYFYSLMVRSLI